MCSIFTQGHLLRGSVWHGVAVCRTAILVSLATSTNVPLALPDVRPLSFFLKFIMPCVFFASSSSFSYSLLTSAWCYVRPSLLLSHLHLLRMLRPPPFSSFLPRQVVCLFSLLSVFFSSILFIANFRLVSCLLVNCIPSFPMPST